MQMLLAGLTACVLLRGLNFIFCRYAVGAFILENGCIHSLETEPSPTQPNFCVPAGLGTRFISTLVLPQVPAVGGVTDAGFIVFTGTLGDSTKCAYVAGPWTAQVTAVLLETTRQSASPLRSARWGSSATITESDRWAVCGLTRGGDLECMRPAGSWWSGSPPGGGSWPDFTTTGLTATMPSDSACVDITRSSSFWAIPLLLCRNTILAQAAGTLPSPPPTCISTHGPFSSFTVSTCTCPSSCISGTNDEMASVIVATRANDSIPMSYHIGFDFFDGPPVTNQARSIWTGTAVGPFAVDPQFPVFRACAHASMPYAGRLANGNYFIVGATADNTNGRANMAAVTNMNLATFSSTVLVRAVTSVVAIRQSNCDKLCSQNSSESTLLSRW